MPNTDKNPAVKSQVYVFYGEDSFSLLRKIDKWKQEFAKKYGNQGVFTLDGETLSDSELLSKISDLTAPSLFASKKLVICKECLPKKAGQEALLEMVVKMASKSDPNLFLVFYSTGKLDQRLNSTKRLLKSGAEVVEFSLPHGSTLPAWLKAYAKQMGAELETAAAEKLAIHLGRDLYEEKKFGGRVVERKEGYDLWQAYQELLKLSSKTPRITVKDVEDLVTPKISENAFNLSDAIFRKDKSGAFRMMENLFSDQSSDEKGIAVKITALLAEQIRAALSVQLFKKKNLSNDEIAESLGWTSGRVFMVQKQVQQSDDKLKKMLSDLLEIDTVLKSQDISPKLLLNKFITVHT